MVSFWKFIVLCVIFITIVEYTYIYIKLTHGLLLLFVDQVSDQLDFYNAQYNKTKDDITIIGNTEAQKQEKQEKGVSGMELKLLYMINHFLVIKLIIKIYVNTSH